MQLLDHPSITVADPARARPFHDAVPGALEVPKVHDRPDALGYGARNSASRPRGSYLSVLESPQASGDARRHVCLRTPSRAHVDAFHRAGLAHGGVDAGAPGLRPHHHADYHAAFLVDPGGNRIEAVCHDAPAAS